MKKIILLTLVASALSVNNLSAHQGHDHDAPTTLKAPKGGVIKALDESRVEVVSKKNDIRIYVYDKDLKPAKASRFKIIAKAELPRTKKSEKIKIIEKEFSFEGSYDAKRAHRYTLLLAVEDSKTGHVDNLTFTIEPRK